MTVAALAELLHTQGEQIKAQGVRFDAHIKKCDLSSQRQETAFKTLTTEVQKITKPFEKVKVEDVVDQFVKFDSFFKLSKRTLLAIACLALTAVIGAAANVYFENRFHTQTIQAVDSATANHYTTKQGASDKADTDARLNAINEKVKP
jgi:uncharacterized protein YjcR